MKHNTTNKVKEYFEADIISYSHNLDKELFDKWNSEIGRNLDSPMYLLCKDKDKLTIRSETQDLPKKLDTAEKKLKYAEIMLTTFVISINIATIGYFWFLPALWPIKFKLKKDGEKMAKHLSHSIPALKYYKEKRKLKYSDIEKAMAIFIALKRLDANYFKRYIGAMNLLSIYNVNYDFAEEVFLNFYKTMERFIALEINKKKKPPKKKEIQKVFIDLGFKKSLKDIDRIYKLRCNTVMHSVGNDINITLEDSMKCKIFTESLLNKYLTEYSIQEYQEYKKGK